MSGGKEFQERAKIATGKTATWIHSLPKEELSQFLQKFDIKEVLNEIAFEELQKIAEKLFQ